MKKAPQVLIGFMTHPDKDALVKMIRNAVSENLIACGNVLSDQATSLFIWQNKLSEEKEFLAIFKTIQERKDACIQYFKEHHPYDCPEILCVQVADGLADYLTWVQDACSPNKS